MGGLARVGVGGDFTGGTFLEVNKDVLLKRVISKVEYRTSEDI